MKKFCLTLIATLFSFVCLSSQTPQILWWFDVDDSAYGQTAAADLNNDGFYNLVFGCYRNDGKVYTLNALDGSLLWEYNTKIGNSDACNDTPPLIFDVLQDGKLEVVVASSCTPITYCFDGATGEIIWQIQTRGSDSPPTIADLDDDGKLEILHGQFGGWVLCINAEDGSKKWEILVDPDSWVQTAPTIVDLDGDGQLDFVVATWNFFNDSKVYAYKGNDRSLLWTLDVNDVIYHGTAIADLNKNGKPELVLGDYSGTLWVINSVDGSVLWTYDAGGYIGSPAVIGDIDGDGFCEIVFSAAYKMIALKYDGSLLWEYTIPEYKQSFRGAALADVDNDTLPDVVFGTSGGSLIALKGTDGSPLFNLDLASHFGAELQFDHAPIIADLTKNGLLDVFIVGGKTNYPDISANYGRAYAVEIGIGAGPEWTMFQRDARRNSSLCQFDVLSVNDDFNFELDFSNITKENPFFISPNPVMDYINIYFTDVDAFTDNASIFSGQININIINSLGECIMQFEKFHLISQKIDVSILLPGVYFLQIGQFAQKFIKL